MLYISAQLGRDKWLVMDTDDGIEEPVTYNDLMECLARGLDIKGVVTHKNQRSTWCTIHVHTEATRSGAKLATLYGIEAKGNNEVLKSFSISQEHAKSCTIRLSEYFTEVDNYAFRGCYTKTGAKIIVILDDNIVIQSKAFLNFSTYNTITFDISEISDDKLAMKLYKGILVDRALTSFEEYESRIIDSNRKRWEQNVALHLLSSGNPTSGGKPTTLKALELFDYNDDVVAFVDKVFGKDFKALSQVSEFYWSDNAGKFWTKGQELSLEQKRIIDVNKRLGFKFNALDVRNSNFLLRNDTINTILSAIGYLTTVNGKVATRLSNYLYYWSVGGNNLYKDYYLRIARNFLDWVSYENDKI